VLKLDNTHQARFPATDLYDPMLVLGGVRRRLRPNPLKQEDASFDTSVLGSSMEDLPLARLLFCSSPAAAKAAHESDWVASAMTYLVRIVQHMNAIHALTVRNDDDAQSRLFSKTTLEMSLDVVDVHEPGAFDGSMRPASEVLRDIRIGENPLSDKEIATAMHVLGGPWGSGVFDDDKLFQGQYHAEGVVASLAMAGAVRAGCLPTVSHPGEVPIINPPIDGNARKHLAHPHKPHLQRDVNRLAAEMTDAWHLQALSKGCCPGCRHLMHYADRLALGRGEDACVPGYLVQPSEMMWTPCTLPPWTPRAAGEYALYHAERELADWISSVLQDERRRAAKAAEDERQQRAKRVIEGRELRLRAAECRRERTSQ